MGWLSDATDWLGEQIEAVWNATEAFFSDLLVGAVETVLDLVSTIANGIPVPEFLQGISICGTLSQAGPTAAWISDICHLPEGMTAIAGGFAFRMLRKLLTLGQW